MKQCEGARYEMFISEMGLNKRVDKSPLIIYGENLKGTGGIISNQSTLNIVEITDLDSLLRILECKELGLIDLDFAGIWAMSSEKNPGEAGRAIKIFKAKNRTRAATFYQAWDYNVQRACRRAIEYQVDGIMMPGIDSNEMFRYLFGVVGEVQEGAQPPTSTAEHEDRLKKYTTEKSAFWKLRDFEREGASY